VVEDVAMKKSSRSLSHLLMSFLPIYPLRDEHYLLRVVVSHIAVFVLKRDIKLQPTNLLRVVYQA